MKTTWTDIAAGTLVASGVAAFFISVAGWFVILPTVGLLYLAGFLA